MAKIEFKSIDEAEAAINEIGRVEDEKIYVPDNIHDYRGTEAYERFWAANLWLRSEHDYDSNLDDVIAYF